MAREQMIKSVARLVPDATVTEAVVLQQRHRWWLAGAALAAVIGIVVAFIVDTSAVVRGVIVGGSSGVGIVLMTTYWIVARTETEVLLCRSRRLFASATGIVGRWPVGVRLDRVGKVLGGDVYELDGERYVTSRMFRMRLQDVADVDEV